MLTPIKDCPANVPEPKSSLRDGLGFDYQIKLSRRRTMVVTVDECEVVVAAPLRTSKRDIHAWIVEKQLWIRRKLQEQAIKAEERPIRTYTDGEQWPILGQQFSLYLGLGSRADAALVDGNLLKLTLSSRSRRPKQAQIRLLLQDWYKEQAYHYLEHRSHEMAEVLGVTIKSVKIRLTKSKWGHCTPDGVLQYNYLIMQAPKAVADYLVAHEVSHRVHLNHSAAFWRTVAKLCPDHLVQRAWLREHSHLLTF